MQLTSVETTPNPNSMKLNVDVDLGAAITYSHENLSTAPGFILKLLAITGVKSAFVCHDFVTLNKDPRVDWHNIVTKATETLGGALKSSPENSAAQATREAAARDGQAHVQVQTFRGVPIQVKVEDSHSQKRVSLGERFNNAAKVIQDKLGADFLKERYWADHGIRYGAPDLVAEEVAQELGSLFNDARLERIVASALGKGSESESELLVIPDSNWVKDVEWQKRLAAVQYFSQAPDSVHQLVLGLQDSNAQVRRLASAALGASGSSDAVEALTKTMLEDEHIGVRRTAADALSDIGDSTAEEAMCRALKDKSKLVRWRAARFLFDLGTEKALSHLKDAASDSEFEVRLEIQAAIQRIEGNEAGIGPAWKRIVEGRNE